MGEECGVEEKTVLLEEISRDKREYGNGKVVKTCHTLFIP